MLPYTSGLCKEEGAASEVPEPSPALCSQSQPAAQPCAGGGDRKDRGPALPLCPQLSARRTIQKAVAHPKEMRHQWTRSCWEQEAPFASPLSLFQCSFVPPKGCSAAMPRCPGWLSHMAPHRKDLKTSLEHLCDHESPGRNTLYPPVLLKAQDSDRRFTVSPASPSAPALPPPQEPKPAASL